MPTRPSPKMSLPVLREAGHGVWEWQRTSLRCRTPVDHQLSPSDICRFVRRQIEHAIGNIVGSAEPTQRGPGNGPLSPLWVRAIAPNGQGRLAIPGVHRIDADILFGVLDGGCL